MTPNVIELKNICKSFFLDTDSEIKVLKNINLEIKKGEFASIIGASGSGKSTLMYIMGCLDTATSGELILNGEDVSKLSEEKLALIRNQNVGFVFQMFNLLARTSALDNVMLPITYSTISFEQGKKRAIELLAKVGLADRIDHTPNQLSGGEQQRVAIARSLINNPALILADEPTGNLDSKSGSEIITLLKEINKAGTTVVLVTHDSEIAKNSRLVIQIKDGQII
jgi:putative ABC transport system ATP-binding protein